MGKLGNFFDGSCSNRKSSEDFPNISSLFHRNDSELILLVDPNKESLVLVVVYTSARWPVSVETARVKESITFFEKEMISDELFLILFGHGGKRVISTGMLSGQLFESLRYSFFNLISLSFSDTWSKWEFSEVSTNSDSSRNDSCSIFF